MFTFFLLTLFAAAFLSVENIVITVAGFVVTAIGTEFTKTYLNAAGAGSVLVAVVVSVVVAVVGIFASSFIGGDGFSLDALVKQSGQIFALATLAYHVVRPGEEQSY